MTLCYITVSWKAVLRIVIPVTVFVTVPQGLVLCPSCVTEKVGIDEKGINQK
jgi:hypothetical protein